MAYRTKTKYTGVYTRESTTRRHEGKPDVCFDIAYKTAEGKLVYEKVGWRSEGYSAAKASEVRAERLHSQRHPGLVMKPVKQSLMTYGQAWAVFKERWLPNLKRPGDESSRYETHIAPRFADVPLVEITPLVLEEFKQALMRTHTVRGDAILASATVRLILSDVRRVYRKMMEWGLYTGPIPTAYLKLPKADNQRERFLTPKEADRLLGALEILSCTWWRLAMISLYTGLRLGEILNLRGQDLDFDAGVLWTDGKTGRRAAYMSDAIKPILLQIRPTAPSALLFTTRRGERMDVTAQSKTFAHAVELVGLNKGITDRRRKVVFHTLRHTFASWLAQQGVPLYTIGELIGHTTVQMTKRYAKLSPDNKREAISLIAKMHASIHES